MSRILVTGGAGYIGSHTCVELLNAGHDVVVFDNLCNSSERALQAIVRITNRQPVFARGDLRDPRALEDVMRAHEFDAVLHFGGLKAVGDSVTMPLAYFDNNVHGTLNLLNSMAAHGVKTIVFSSSATVYGDAAAVPIAEDAPTSTTNPYGRSKLIIEQMLTDLHASDPSWRVSLLRYFNPVGAHDSGELGEDPQGIPNNLMPYISQVAVGKLPYVRVFGNDYPTRDGTGVRDYIHVTDLARGHLAALEFLGQRPQLAIHNLGTGRGYSVMEAISAFEAASGRTIPHQIVERRPGDIAECYADPARAERELGWRAHHGLDDMCRDVWRWQSKYPDGFR
jgi:UDP-glucose 4-epimerase